MGLGTGSGEVCYACVSSDSLCRWQAQVSVLCLADTCAS